MYAVPVVIPLLYSDREHGPFHIAANHAANQNGCSLSDLHVSLAQLKFSSEIVALQPQRHCNMTFHWSSHGPNSPA